MLSIPESAIGYTSLASLKNNVTVLTVDGVAPTEETIKNGSYAVQRPFVIITRSTEALSDEAQAFFDYMTSGEATQIISDAGVVAAIETL